MVSSTSAETVRRMKSSKHSEWYTPERYIDAAREVMGDIDLDPASCVLAQETVRAGVFYTKEDDGLALPWFGRVWLNPPYGKLGPAFVTKAVEAYRAGDVEAAILMLNGYSYQTRWFQPLFDYAICWHAGRVDYHTPCAGTGGSAHGTALVYLGRDVSRFVDEFGRFGPVTGRLGATDWERVMHGV